MLSKPATLDDVAALAGVSGKTVSRVVNGGINVSAATRERVEQAIGTLGFSPNLSARSLAAARSFLIAAVSQRMTAHYVDEVHRGAAEACRASGYHLTIEALDPSDEAQFAVFRHTLRQMRFDGVILVPPLTDHPALLDLLDAQGTRYVRLSPLADRARSDALFADESAGVAMIVERLWRDGHRRFGVIEGPASHLATRLRRDGAVTAVARLGGDASSVAVATVRLSPEPADTADIPASLAIRVGHAGAAMLLRALAPPTAILAFNDDVAAGVIGYAHDQGIAVPDALSVVGFDDAATALVTWPPLTTIRQPIARMAQIAVGWLTGAPAATAREEMLPVELVPRASTGAAPIRRGERDGSDH